VNGGKQVVDRLQDGFRAGPHAYAPGQVFPPDNSFRIYQKLGGARDIVTVLASAGMKHAVLADHLRFRIGEKRERVTLAGAECARVLVGVDADGGNLDAARVEIVQAPFETPQLGVAEGSPVAAIENEQHSPVLFQ